MTTCRGLVFLSAVVPLVAGGCDARLSGPGLEVGTVAPGLVCRDQLTTEVAVAGSGFSPMVLDAATSGTRLDLPRVLLTRTQDLSGAAVEADPIEVPNDPRAPADAHVRWSDSGAMAFDVYPALALAPGLYRLTVRNANGSGADLDAAVLAVPRPTLAAIEPDLACTAQGARPFTLRGTGFIRIPGVLPTVAIGAVTVPMDALSDCVPLPGAFGAETCATGAMTLPEDAPDPGKVAVSVTNPATAACRTEETVTAAIVPAPTLGSTVPDLACVAQGDRVFDLAGTGFVRVGTDLPDVAFSPTAGGDALVREPDVATGCAAIDGTLLDAASCSALRVTVADGSLTPGAYGLQVRNPPPAGCVTVEPVTLAVVPPPSLETVTPDLACLDEGDRTIGLRGAGFVRVGDDLPDVHLAGAAGDPLVVPASAATPCAAIDGTLLDAESCLALDVVLPSGGLEPGSYSITIANPDPAGCASVEAVTLAVVPRPKVSSVTPDLACTADGGAQLAIGGEGFVRIGAALPTVRLGAVAVTTDAASGCAAIDGTTSGAEACATLAVTVPDDAELPPGVFTVTVENPPPAGCGSADAVQVVLVGPPVATAVVPPAVCVLSPAPLMELVGQGFIQVDGVLPTLAVDGAPVAGVEALDCSAIPVTALAALSCSRLRFPAPPGGFALGTHEVTVVNPPPADCATAKPAVFSVASPPAVTDVDPERVCVTDGRFTVTGAGFVAGTAIVLDGPGGPFPVTTNPISDTSIEGVTSGQPAGDYGLVVSNGDGCDGRLDDAIELVDAPIAYFVDPPRVYNGINLQVTIYVSGISGSVTAVGIRPTGTAEAPAPLSFTFDPARPNRILATVPAGTAAGDWDVVISDELCTAGIANALHVTADLTVTVAAVEPPFGWTGSRTGVVVRSSDAPPAGEVAFAATPRAYLNPSEGGEGIFATELKAVAFVASERLTAVVPEGLAAGPYDLVVINPDGGVGLLPAAFRVVADPPPEIAELSPGSVVNKATQAVTVLGRNFRAPVQVTATCRTAGGDVDFVATVAGATATSVSATWDFTSLAGGDVCVVRVANAGDGTWAVFSALTVLNPAQNLNPFESSSEMVRARRAAAGAAIRADSASRFLFAIGGDAGASTPAWGDVEGAPVDPFGEVGTWTVQRNPLPAGRTLAQAAVVGRFVHVAGGSVAGAPTGSVVRAFLLDPLDVPVIDDLDFEVVTDGSGLGPGIWYYRVSAVMEAGYASNPGGEALPSEPLVVQVPDLGEGRRVHLRFKWDAIPDVASWRVYRSPVPGGKSGDERLLAAVPGGAEAFTDTGLAVPEGAAEPLPIGSLGAWHEVATLAHPREGAAVVAVPAEDVAAGDPQRDYLYVLGGRAGSVATGVVERLTVVREAADRQSVTGLADELAIPDPRWLGGAVYVDSKRGAAVQPGSPWVYALPGKTGAGATVGTVFAFRVGAGGALAERLEVDGLNTGYAGYAPAAGNNFLFLLGGSGGSPSSTGHSAELCREATGGCKSEPIPPALKNWNAGQALVTPRYLVGSAVESSFVFVLGGQTATEAASRSTERTNL